MIRLRLFSHSIILYACLGSFLMRGSLGQKPVLSVGSFTSLSNLQCIRPAVDTLTLEGTVNLNGADASDWVGNGVEFRSPQTLICTVSLIECPPSSLTGCYCEQYDESTETYTVKFTRPAAESYSEQSIFMRIARSNFEESVTSGQAIYPYVNEDVSATISYGSKSKSADIDGTALDIPEDDQLVNMTISGLRPNFAISYSTDISVISGEVENTNHISIPLTNNTTLLTVSYEEDDYCERDGSYSFTITSVRRQSPHLDIGALTKPACPVEGRGMVSLEATVTVAGADLSDWDQTVAFRFEDEDLCSAHLGECPPSDLSTHACYCEQHVGDMFTIIGNLEASSLLSGKEIRMEMVSSDYSVLQRSESIVYPLIDRDHVQITMTYVNDYRNRRYSPPVNNSMLDHPEDNQRLILTVDGLKEPFSIVYVKLNEPIQIEVTNNRSSVTFPIDDDVERIQLTYEESLNCHREAVYYLSFEEGSSDDLSTGAIVGIVFGAILFVVIIIFFVIVYLLVRARGDDKETSQRSRSNSVEERGYIIDYSSKDVEDGRGEENGRSYDNKAYAVDVPANSSSVVMNPVFDEGVKENEYSSLDATTQDEPGPSYEGLSNGKPTGTSASEVGPNDAKPTEASPSYVDLEDVKPTETAPGDETVNGVKPSREGPYVSIIRTSL